eukprot:382638-Rhodomonas_salina.1
MLLERGSGRRRRMSWMFEEVAERVVAAEKEQRSDLDAETFVNPDHVFAGVTPRSLGSAAGSAEGSGSARTTRSYDATEGTSSDSVFDSDVLLREGNVAAGNVEVGNGAAAEAGNEVGANNNRMPLGPAICEEEGDGDGFRGRIRMLFDRLRFLSENRTRFPRQVI